jgi:hypothetical protein
VAWRAVMRIVAGVGDLVLWTEDGQAQVGCSVAGRSRGWVMLCAVCTLYKETRSVGFLVWPQNQGRRFLSVWPQNRWFRVSRFGSQNRQLRFCDLGLKITVTVSWFGPQNQVGNSLSVAPQNRQENEDGMGHVSRSSDLLRLEASRARVFQSGLKIGGGAVWMIHLASSRRLCRVESEDRRVDATGYIGSFYPNLDIFIVLGSSFILVF